MTSRDTRRGFTPTQRNEILYQQDNKCAKCHNPLDPRAKHFHHIKEWSAKGQTLVKNGAAVCPTCHAVITHEERLKKLENKGIDNKSATELSLKKLNNKQLKYLADKHKIKLKGRLVGDMWESHREAPTNGQYIKKLLGIVTNKDLKSLPEEDPKPVKNKRKKSSDSWW